MSPSPTITIVQPNLDGSLPIPTPVAPHAAEAAAAQLQERAEALQEQMDGLQALLAKPLNEILEDREKALEAASAWDAFGAMWLLSQRAMRRVAMDLAAQQGVINTEDETLGGSIAPAQMAHIARHRPYLRKQFRQG